MAEVAITGIGLVTPLGCDADADSGADCCGARTAIPAGAVCSVRWPVACCRPGGRSSTPARHFPENKTLRLMNRDAQMAVVAARLAMRDAGVVPGELYPAEEIALYGATGLCGMPPAEIAGLLRQRRRGGRLAGPAAVRPGGPAADSARAVVQDPGQHADLLRVDLREPPRPQRGLHAWEGQGAQAIAAGIRAVGDGEVPCAPWSAGAT